MSKFQTAAVSPVRGRAEPGSKRLRYLAHVYSDGSRASDVEFVPVGKGLIIGREPGVGRFVLDDAEASRKHAELEVSGG